MFNMLSDKEKIKLKIEDVLKECREYLNKDNGDIELVEIEDDGIVKLRYLGTCKICPLSLMTLRGGIERAILNASSEIKRVELVS